MTSETAYCTLGKHLVSVAEMRKPPPSCPSRRQCNACASGRARAARQRKPAFDWAARFLERVVEDDDCWTWTGAHANGYGVTTVLGELHLTHRVSYFLHHGDMPAGAFICHHCDNRGCCNPDHLYAGDYQTNSDDAVARDRLDPPLGERNGHAILTAPNVLDLRADHRLGWTHQELARKYGCSAANVYKVVNYKSWRHVA